MKNYLPGIICLLMMFSCIGSAAQKNLPVREPDTNRPSLFPDQPQRFGCHISNLENLLDAPIGKKIGIQLSDNLLFQGTISSVSSQDDKNVQSVVVRSTNLQGAALTFSKVTRDDGSSYFTGRIISFQHTDVYEITYEKGQYAFVKKGFNDLVIE